MKRFYFVIILVSLFFFMTSCNFDKEIYSDEEIYLVSFECGYISEEEKLPDIRLLIIENEEQLSFAEEYYGLKMPDYIAEEDYSDLHDFIPYEFLKMKENYPLDEFSYVIQYDEVSSGGYYYHADRLEIDGERIYFQLDDESHSPREDVVETVMGGFCHMAAVPKEYLSERNFSNVFYPDPDDMYQDRDYKIQIYQDVADESLYQVYGENKYIIRNQEEYDRFLDMSKGIAIDKGGAKTLEVGNVDFDKVALLTAFFTRDDICTSCYVKPVEINIKNINLNYELKKQGVSQKTTLKTGMICVRIPKKYLTEDSYEGWIIP